MHVFELPAADLERPRDLPNVVDRGGERAVLLRFGVLVLITDGSDTAIAVLGDLGVQLRVKRLFHLWH
jgi:hypothetical protein